MAPHVSFTPIAVRPSQRLVPSSRVRLPLARTARLARFHDTARPTIPRGPQHGASSTTAEPTTRRDLGEAGDREVLHHDRSPRVGQSKDRQYGHPMSVGSAQGTRPTRPRASNAHGGRRRDRFARERRPDSPAAAPPLIGVVGFDHPTCQDRTVWLEPLPRHVKAELVEPAGRRQLSAGEACLRSSSGTSRSSGWPAPGLHPPKGLAPSWQRAPTGSTPSL